jgi:hypothetical protein
LLTLICFSVMVYIIAPSVSSIVKAFAGGASGRGKVPDRF